MSDDDKVTRLPVRFKSPPDGEQSLRLVRGKRGECDHRWFFDGVGKMRSVSYDIREGETEVECSNCGARLDPMWVLGRLANEESIWLRNRERYADEMKRLAERQSTKCQHCNRMTRISRK